MTISTLIKYHFVSVICMVIALMVTIDDVGYVNLIEAVLVYIALMWGTAGYMCPSYFAERKKKRSRSEDSHPKGRRTHS